jgi:fibronectin type 3 domain-containing protein
LGYVPDEIIVAFDEDVPLSEKVDEVKDLGGESLEEIGEINNDQLHLVALQKGQDVEQAVKEYSGAGDPAIEYVQPNYIYTQLNGMRTSDPGISKQWNLNKIDTQEAWDYIDRTVKTDGEVRDRVNVATIDTGASSYHSDLLPVNGGGSFDRAHSVAVTTSPYKTNYSVKYGHGTSTTGMIGATSNNGRGLAGVASGNGNDLINLMAINVFDRYDYSQASATTENIIKGIEYAVDEGNADIIMMCLGHSPTGSYGTNNHDDKALKNTIDSAVLNYDTLFVTSAGNKGNEKPWYPSDFENCISCINTTNYTNAFDVCKASNSSYGSKKDISAPGTDVPTLRTDGSYSNGSGTSYSAPTVAAVAALVKYVAPELNSKAIKNILYSTATDLYKYGYDEYTGWGNVNAYSAVTKAHTGTARIVKGILTNPIAKAVPNGYKSIKVSWKRVKTANGYNIYRATTRDGAYSRVKTIRNGSVVSWINNDLKTAKKYYYKVSAFGTVYNKKTYSAQSPIVWAKAIPKAPYVNASTSYNSIKLSWKKVSGVTGYRIYRATSKNGKYKFIAQLKDPNRTSWTNVRLKTKKTYHYKVRAWRNMKTGRLYGAYSNTRTCLAIPGKVSLTLKKSSSLSIRLSWKKISKINGYVIYRATSADGKYKKIKALSSGSSYWINKNLKKGKTYYYKMRSYKNKDGKRIYGNYSSVKSKRI